MQTLGSTPMKVDGGIGFELAATSRRRRPRTRATTASGPRRPVTTRSSRCCSPPSTPSRSSSAPAIAVAFARNPMTLANLGNDLQAYSKGRFILGLGSQIKPHIKKRFSMAWSHPAPRMREMILAMRAIWDCWNDGTKLDFRGDFYTPHADDAVLQPRPEPVRHRRRSSSPASAS